MASSSSLVLGIISAPPVSTVAAGSAFTLTATNDDVVFGTTSPTVTLSAGTYLISVNLQTSFAGATYVAVQSVTYNLRRTNNTAADIAGTTFSQSLPIVTTITVAAPSTSIANIVYVASAGDVIGVRGILSATPSAGSVTCSAATISALKVG